MATKSQLQALQNTLERICKLTGDCWSEKQAINNKKDSWLSIDHQPGYGGYRLERTQANTRSNIPAFDNISDTCPRLNHSEFSQLLRGIYTGLTAQQPNKLKEGEIIIDNNQRIFMLTWSMGFSAFCNLKDLGGIINQKGLKKGQYSLYHFWNNKPQKVTKKLIIEMFEAHGLPIDFEL